MSGAEFKHVHHFTINSIHLSYLTPLRVKRLRKGLLGFKFWQISEYANILIRLFKFTLYYK
jgi:hypothetical protein